MAPSIHVAINKYARLFLKGGHLIIKVNKKEMKNSRNEKILDFRIGYLIPWTRLVNLVLLGQKIRIRSFGIGPREQDTGMFCGTFL